MASEPTASARAERIRVWIDSHFNAETWMHIEDEIRAAEAAARAPLEARVRELEEMLHHGCLSLEQRWWRHAIQWAKDTRAALRSRGEEEP